VLNTNVAAILAERGARHPDRLAIATGTGRRTERITFGGLARRAAALAAGLDRAGIRPGDRVLLFAPVSIDLYVALLGSLHAGATAVFVEAWAGRRRLAAAVAAARPAAMIATPRAHLLRLAAGPVRRIPVHWIASRRLLPLRRRERPEGAEPPARVPPEAPALVTFTTGSTGAPKAVARTHGFLRAQREALAAALPRAEGDVDMPALPMFLLANLAAGIPSVVPDWDPRRPLALAPAAVYCQIVAERVTTSTGSPAFYERLARWCADGGRVLPLRAVFTGGAPVYPPLARLLAATVAGTAHVVYGCTEAEPIAAIEARAMLDAMASAPAAGLCAGPPVPGLSVRVVRPHAGPIELGARGWGEWEVARGSVGEVVVAGAHVLESYLGDPAADQARKIREGPHLWHRTGDAAWLDAEGRLWLVGRVGQAVTRDGAAGWSILAELRALAVPGVRHAAYLAVEGDAGPPRAVLCVEPEAGRLSGSQRAAVRAALGAIPVDEIHEVAAIPRDRRHASKVDVAALRRRLRRRAAP
jgi:acyl-CoA synthetase (AMP-forming)/AMP-acid ligase II